MKYVLKRIHIERHPIDTVTLDKGTADRIKKINAEVVGRMDSDVSVSRGDVVILDDNKWLVTDRIIVHDQLGDYIVLYVNRYNEYRERQYMNRVWTDYIPLFPNWEEDDPL